MDNCKKLVRIKYNNKTFDVFVNNDNIFAFLEVKKDNEIIKYCCPKEEDYINLFNMYNNTSSILYSKQDDSKYRTFLKAMAISMLLTKSYSGNTELVSDEIVEDSSIKESDVLSSGIEDFENDDYKITGNLVVLKKVDELELIGINNVTYDELRNTFENNPNLKSNFFIHKYVNNYINALEERMPDLDLRVLNHNLKTLEINIIPEEEWENKDINGFYSITENKIGIRESARHNIKTIYHELSHALTNLYTNDSIELDGRYIEDAIIYRGVKEIYNSYGKSMDEGMNTIITAYLLSDNYETFFDDVDVSNLTVYTEIVDVYYEGFKLIKDEYTIEDYLSSYYEDFESKLNEYNIHDLIPMCDVIMATTGDAKTELIDDSEFVLLKENILKNRVMQLQDDNASEVQIVKELGVFDIDNNYNIYYEQNNDDHMITVETDNSPSAFNIDAKITDNENVLYDSAYYNIYIYGANGDYRFAILDKTIRFGELGIYRVYYDLLTKESIEGSEYNFYSVSTLANGIFDIPIGTSRNHKVTFDISILNEPIVIEHYDQLNKENELIIRK